VSAADDIYRGLVLDVLQRGKRKPSRAGVDTRSAFGHFYSLEVGEEFPLLRSKRIEWRHIVIETLWYLLGDRDVAFLRAHDCRFWDPWADDRGNVPSAYGYLWRNAAARTAENLDQIRWVLDTLKRDPFSRRMVVSAWEPRNAHFSALPPCHFAWVLNATPEEDGEPRLNLHLSQRSADVALGVPYNLAGYALLLHLFARFAGLRVGSFAHSITDAHVYTAKVDGSGAEYDHVPGLLEQIAREPRPAPRLVIAPELRTLGDVIDLACDGSTEEIMGCFRLEGYDPHPAIRFKVAV
jgi:thymidylate synthase